MNFLKGGGCLLCSLQLKQQAIICFEGYELTTANLFKTGLVLILA